jgi:hypothetical protein
MRRWGLLVNFVELLDLVGVIGLGFKPSQASFLATLIILVDLWVDLKALWSVFAGLCPIHRFFHLSSGTYLGFVVPGVVTTPIGALSSPAAMAFRIRAQNASSISK